MVLTRDPSGYDERAGERAARASWSTTVSWTEATPKSHNADGIRMVFAQLNWAHRHQRWILDRRTRYRELRQTLAAILEGEDDWIAALATVVCELHQSFDYFDWTGFYRAKGPHLLVIGPYQGGHGCLRIDFDRGICGAAARTGQTQLVDDVESRSDHIRCSSTTRSEIVVPVLTPDGVVLAVLDVDSNTPAAFDVVDQAELELICADLGSRFAHRASRH